MSTVDLGVLVCTVATTILGSWSIYWARAEAGCWRCRSGRVLFVLNLLALGATGLVAAFFRAQGLAPLGLVAGMLVVGLMWEGPTPAARRHRTLHTHLPPEGQAS